MCKVNLTQVANKAGVFYYLPLRLLPAERVAASAESINLSGVVSTTIGKQFPRTNITDNTTGKLLDCPLRIIFVSSKF